MGINHISAVQLMELHQECITENGGITYIVFKRMVISIILMFIRENDGRYYVLLSLPEAEHMRGVFHSRVGVPLLGMVNESVTEFVMEDGNLVEKQVAPSKPVNEGASTFASLWLLSDSTDVLLESSHRSTTASAPQHAAMCNSFRYLNSDVFFDSQSLSVLLRLLDTNSCSEREKWWTDIRSCRRRRQVELTNTAPIRTVFSSPSEFKYLEFKAIVQRVLYGLQQKGMLVFDAFRSFNSSNTGFMNCSELYGGLESLGIKLVPDQIYDIVRKVGIEQVGLISYADFRRVFHTSEEDVESRGVSADGGNSSFETVEPKPIPELFEEVQSVNRIIVINTVFPLHLCFRCYIDN